MNQENNFELQVNYLEDKEKEVKQKLFKVRLEYAQRLFERKLDPPGDDIKISEMSFGQILGEFADLPTEIREDYFNRIGRNIEDIGIEKVYKEYNDFYKKVIEKLVNLYENDPDNWIAQAPKLVLENINQIPFKEKVTLTTENETKEFRAGILKYIVGPDHYDLQDIGISENDECIKTHLDPLFTQKGFEKEKKLSELYEKAYRIIAKEVKEKYPNVKAIISESWLFDTSLADELGLHTYKGSNYNNFLGRPFWGQFITKEGEINKERVKQLLETGKPPFRVKNMYMLIDEFLEKYGSSKS